MILKRKRLKSIKPLNSERNTLGDSQKEIKYNTLKEQVNKAKKIKYKIYNLDESKRTR